MKWTPAVTHHITETKKRPDQSRGALHLVLLVVVAMRCGALERRFDQAATARCFDALITDPDHPCELQPVLEL